MDFSDLVVFFFCCFDILLCFIVFRCWVVYIKVVDVIVILCFLSVGFCWFFSYGNWMGLMIGCIVFVIFLVSFGGIC